MLLKLSQSPTVAKVKRKREEEEPKDYPHISYTDEEMNPVTDKWMADSVPRPFKPGREPTLEDMRKSFYCRKAVAAILFHIRGNEEEMASNASMPLAAISALQRSSNFRTLFNQLGLKEESRRTATEAFVSIVANSGTHCLRANAHASQAFLDTTNAITFTEEDMEIQHTDHSRPLYVVA
nr:hypothetical protein CFP56_24708 [Quercus suber]